MILITAHGSVDTAVGAIKLGAYDYITKPFQMDELLLIVERVGKILGLRRENIELKEVLEDRFSFSGILGCSHHMRGAVGEDQAACGHRFTGVNRWGARDGQRIGGPCHPFE